MATTAADLQALVVTGDEDLTVLDNCLNEAKALVDKYVGAVVVPEVVLDRAHLEVAADLFNRRKAPNGILNQQFATADGLSTNPIRISRDPMQAAYKILGRWVRPF